MSIIVDSGQSRYVMESNIEKIQKGIEDLRKKGFYLECGLRNEMGMPYSDKELATISDEETRKEIKRAKFKDKYQYWYNASLAAIKQLLPDRVEDFISAYHQNVTKEKNLTNYGIEDFILGLTLTSYSKEINNRFIRGKFNLQYQIVCSLKDRLESSLFDIKQLVESDMFDSEIDSAAMLAKRGFLRGAGAICGVVLEKHLKTVAKSHSIKISKKTPTINDLNDLLKNNNVIDVAQWRYLQFLGDIRNSCDHDKTPEPTINMLDDFIYGVRKVLKTVY